MILQKPNEVAKRLDKSTPELLNIGISRLSSQSLSDLAKKNPKKYEMQMLGIIALNFNISIEELINYGKLRDSIKLSTTTKP